MVIKKIVKLGASEYWFKRRRGGQEEKDLKVNSWRDRPPQEEDRSHEELARRIRGERRSTQHRKPADEQQEQQGETWQVAAPIGRELHELVETTMLVPFTPRVLAKEAHPSWGGWLHKADQDKEGLGCWGWKPEARTSAWQKWPLGAPHGMWQPHVPPPAWPGPGSRMRKQQPRRQAISSQMSW